MLVLESQSQADAWGSMASQHSLLGESRSGRDPVSKQTKPNQVESAKTATLGAELWPQHTHVLHTQTHAYTPQKEEPHCSALIIIPCYPPFPEITIILNFIVLLPVVLAFATFACLSNVC